MTNESNPFRAREKSSEEIMEDIWKDLQIIKLLTSQTNGRVTDLERFRYVATGALLVINVLLVPVAVAVTISLIQSGLTK